MFSIIYHKDILSYSISVGSGGLVAFVECTGALARLGIITKFHFTLANYAPILNDHFGILVSQDTKPLENPKYHRKTLSPKRLLKIL